jgi:hypothetical protein
MSWDQSYSVPTVNELLEQLTCKTSLKLLKDELERQGLQIVKSEEVVLDDGFYQTVTGLKITLSDGRVFVPKLVKKETANGNWGCDIYEYRLQDEEVNVEHVDSSDTCEHTDCGCGGCGCDDEVGC